MAYPSKFAEIEKQRGKPIAEVMVETLNTEGSLEQAARALKVSLRRFVGKYQECGIEKDPPHWRLPEAEDVHS